jgi:hypothetical protein
MNVRFTGASLALISVGLLAAAGVRKKKGAKNEAKELAGFEKIDLGDRPGWVLRERGEDQIVFTSDNGKWIVVGRNKKRPESLMLRWEGGEDQAEAASEARRRFGGVLDVTPQRERPTGTPLGHQEEKRVWKMVFDSREDALAMHQEEQDLMMALDPVIGKKMATGEETVERFESGVHAEPDGSYAYIYQAVHPHPGSALVIRGSENSESDERKKIKQAGKAAGLLDFNAWVKEVAKIRGRPLSDADPYRPAIEASAGETWYDVWLDKVPPEEAAKLGSRNVR